MSALSAVATAISDLDEEGYPVDDLREALEAFAELIEAAKQVHDACLYDEEWGRLYTAIARVNGGAA